MCVRVKSARNMNKFMIFPYVSLAKEYFSVEKEVLQHEKMFQYPFEGVAA